MYSKFIIRHKERDLKLCFIQTIVQVSFSFNVTTIFYYLLSNLYVLIYTKEHINHINIL